MPLASSSSAAAPPPQNLKHRVFTCLNKLSDRDTYGVAAAELDSIARSIEPSSLGVFVSCINSTDASDKSPVRKQCVRILSVLGETHGDALSPHLSKVLSSVTRRLRDPDSAVRSACVDAVTALRYHVSRPPFSSFLKPLADALFTEQDLNSQIGAALCLAAAVDAAQDPETAKLARLMPRFEKLLKCESFKAKPALLVLFGSLINAGAASGEGALRSLVPAVVQFLSSDDWAARKAAAEVLVKLASVERDALAEFKSGCLKTFENRRFDKVKAVREIMNQMLEAWKQIPDVSGNLSPPPQSQASSKDNASDGRYPPGARNSGGAGSEALQLRKRPVLPNKATPPDSSYTTTARKRSYLKSEEKKANSGLFRKLDKKKPSNWNVNVAVPNGPSERGGIRGDDRKERDGDVSDKRSNEKTKLSKLETKRALFYKSSDDKGHRFGGFRSGSRVAPCQEESNDSTVVVSNATADIHKNHTECEDLTLIRHQLVQIEKQQSSLLDLLQRFMGSSQNGMQSLETRVHGLELALDEISYDLALSSGRMTKMDSSRTRCCMLPGADFLSSKFWKRSEGRYSAPRISTSSGTPSAAAMRFGDDSNGNAERFKSNRMLRLQGGGGFIVNPLAEIPRNPVGNAM
ncbi:TORTIFOLIA1-like protein 3 [Humulus lupulus]|uniref:TORTIFOLIA1-like protein 3 n=1 Tax=Humulus lupulus TaxID=3486 RepID=UPI002B41114C|nr:TORTIFOLIA1-like protein 3 [Humulus lupulus]